jgi:hypothetical protein
MSSAILYLAIVVIWAFLLVPRWIHRPHTAFFAGTDSAGQDTDSRGHNPADIDSADTELAGHGTEPGLTPAEADDGYADAEGPPPPKLSILRAVDAGGTSGPSANWHAQDREQAQQPPEPDTAPLPKVTAPRPGADPAPAGAAATASAPSAGISETTGPAGPPRPPISRAKILQARRRLLTTLVLLAIAATICTALKLTSAWVCVPPAGMLVMYVLLLREAALADAEKARARAEQSGAARQRARARAREAWAARTPQPTAEIIDISARLGDQLYDQYADATVRAVGD